MISYDKLFKLMEKQGVTKYALKFKHGLNNATIQRLRTNKSVTLDTIEKLCNILQCKIEEIVEIIPDKLNHD